eukprot:2035144-Rhodomonas_salina.9
MAEFTTAGRGSSPPHAVQPIRPLPHEQLGKRGVLYVPIPTCSAYHPAPVTFSSWIVQCSDIVFLCVGTCSFRPIAQWKFARYTENQHLSAVAILRTTGRCGRRAMLRAQLSEPGRIRESDVSPTAFNLTTFADRSLPLDEGARLILTLEDVLQASGIRSGRGWTGGHQPVSGRLGFQISPPQIRESVCRTAVKCIDFIS